MKSDNLKEANIVDLSDDEIKELLGYLFESLKRQEELKKADPDLQQMQEALKNYIRDNYSDENKNLKARLKAARNQAKVRGIKYNVPEGMK